MANTLLSKTKTWNALGVEERSVIATTLLDTIENALFNIKDASKLQLDASNIGKKDFSCWNILHFLNFFLKTLNENQM